MLGRNSFPPIGELPYLLTLPAYGFFWFRLSTDAAPPRWHTERLPVEDLAVLVLFDGWNSFFRSRVVPWRIGMAEKTRAQLERELLPRFMRRQRWYAGKAEPLNRVTLAEHALLEAGRLQEWLLALADVQGTAPVRATSCRWPMAFDDDDEERTRDAGCAGRQQGSPAGEDGRAGRRDGRRALLPRAGEAIGSGREVLKAKAAACTSSRRHACSPRWSATRCRRSRRCTRLTTEQQLASLLGDRLFLKAYRRVQPGINPELEMGRFLTDVVGYANSVPVAGSVEFHAADGTVWTLALLQAQVSNQGDAWHFTVDQLARLLEAHMLPGTDPQAGMPRSPIRTRCWHGAWLNFTSRWPAHGDPAFDPEPVPPADLQAHGRRRCAGTCVDTLALLAARRDGWAPPLASLADAAAAPAPAAGACRRCGPRRAARPEDAPAWRPAPGSRCWSARDDFLIIDFEGEPQRRSRAACQAQRAARCGRHAALVRLRAPHRVAPAALPDPELERPGRPWRAWAWACAPPSSHLCRSGASGGLWTTTACFAAVRTSCSSCSNSRRALL
jgi:maltose alpha-D-glucosyltransferase/alpha-amylase